MEAGMNTSPVFIPSVLNRIALRRGAVFGGILLLALFAFEIFNYSTTDFALTDMLGANLRFLGVRWATILSFAFCGIDFAGIARLVTPEQGRNQSSDVWYLFGAWLLAAAMNASLTWWGVAVAVQSHQELASMVIGRNMLVKVVPVFVALMVWLIRVLIIGTFSMAGERLFSLAEVRSSTFGNAIHAKPIQQHSHSVHIPQPNRPASNPFTPALKPEPTYQPSGMAVSLRRTDASIRR
jgi:hypothetical protein